MESTDVEVCFGTANKWVECKAALFFMAGSLKLVLLRSMKTNSGCSTVSQILSLAQLAEISSVYYSVRRPHCLQLARQQSQKVWISFQKSGEKEEWNAVLLSHLKASKNELPAVTELQSLPRNPNATLQNEEKTPNHTAQSDQHTRSITSHARNTPEYPGLSSDNLSDEDDDYSDGENPYATIEHYHKPPLPDRMDLSECPPSVHPPPPLPTRHKMTPIQHRIQSLCNHTNELLTKIHKLVELEEQKYEKLTSDPPPESTELLVNLDVPAESLHFDSIPVPAYPSPAVPHSESVIASDYLKPQPQPPQLENDTHVEPIYAKINKKKPPKLTTSVNMCLPAFSTTTVS